MQSVTGVQITVDLGTDLGLVDKINTVVGAFIADNADFSGSYSVNVCECTAPLKLGISVWWENSFNGAPWRQHRPMPASMPSHAVTRPCEIT